MCKLTKIRGFFAVSKNIFKFAHQETREKTRLNEKKRALYIVNRIFQKKFQKGVDNSRAMCYNIQALKDDPL